MHEKKLTEYDFEQAAARIGCEVAAIKAVTSVESRGSGFDPEGFPITLFEGHWFHKLTKGAYSASHPTLSYPKWTRQFYGKSWQQEKARLQQAIELDRTAGMLSASWGMFQIMGFNHKLCGFADVQSFVNAMCESEGKQLDAFVTFILGANLASALISKNWAAFAKTYNGPEYAKNAYDVKLQAAYKKHAGV